MARGRNEREQNLEALRMEAKLQRELAAQIREDIRKG
jgi:hypothetical protein